MREWIRDVQDFPKQGIVFKDIFPLLQNHFTDVVDALAHKIAKPSEIDFIAGIDSRGFIFAAALAYKLQKGFIPIRKKGKLAPPTLTEHVLLEYGIAEIEMAERLPSQKKDKILIVDDILATGGTIESAWNLSLRCGFLPQQVLVLIDLKSLHRDRNLTFPVTSLLDYD
jgi:adenine phosphoribosyltransferase